MDVATRVLRIGVIGVGRIGRMHADLLARRIPGATVTRVHAADAADADDPDAQHPRSDVHQSSRSDSTTSQWPLSADFSSAAWTPTHSSAAAKPGSCSRPSANERQNS